MFTLAISCLTFQFALILGPNTPGSYAILLFTASDLASITSHIHTWVLFFLWLCFFILLELFLHWSPVAYVPTDLESSSFNGLSFCLFILFMGFPRQEHWSGFPFPSPADHVLSELSTMTRLSWVALQGMAYSFIELDEAVVHVIRLVSFLWLLFSVCLPSDGEGKEAYGSFLKGGDWLRGKLGLVLMGKAMISKSLIFCRSVELCFLPIIWPEATLWCR